jgi:hypothetical protein
MVDLSSFRYRVRDVIILDFMNWSKMIASARTTPFTTNW